MERPQDYSHEISTLILNRIFFILDLSSKGKGSEAFMYTHGTSNFSATLLKQQKWTGLPLPACSRKSACINTREFINTNAQMKAVIVIVSYIP